MRCNSAGPFQARVRLSGADGPRLTHCQRNQICRGQTRRVLSLDWCWFCRWIGVELVLNWCWTGVNTYWRRIAKNCHLNGKPSRRIAVSWPNCSISRRAYAHLTRRKNPIIYRGEGWEGSVWTRLCRRHAVPSALRFFSFPICLCRPCHKPS